MDLNGNCAYAISQNVVLTPGASYSLSFKLHYNPCGPDVIKTGLVQVTGSAAQIFTISDAASSVPWQLTTYNFIATAANSVVTIGSTLYADSCGPAIDDVQLTLVYGAALASVPVAPSSQAYGTNLFTNGDFESSTLAPWTVSSPGCTPFTVTTPKAYSRSSSLNLK